MTQLTPARSLSMIIKSQSYQMQVKEELSDCLTFPDNAPIVLGGWVKVNLKTVNVGEKHSFCANERGMGPAPAKGS